MFGSELFVSVLFVCVDLPSDEWAMTKNHGIPQTDNSQTTDLTKEG